MAKQKLDRESEEEKHIRTVLEKDISFTGTLKFDTSLKIKGIFSGTIESPGTVIIGRDAVVKAAIKAKHVVIYGRSEGNIRSEEKTELLPGARLDGDVRTPDLIIHSRSIFNGKCYMSRSEKDSKK